MPVFPLVEIWTDLPEQNPFFFAAAQFAELLIFSNNLPTLCFADKVAK